MNAVRQAGVGLIEVAVALLVLAVGALGLARLQLASQQLGFEAVQRSAAAAMAQDLLERMRANRAGLAAYQTAGIGAASGAALPIPASSCQQLTCSPAEAVAWDLWQWQQALDGAAVTGSAGGLVWPTGCVAVNGRLVTVEIAWQGYRALSAPAKESSCGTGSYGPGDAQQQLLHISSWIGRE